MYQNQLVFKLKLKMAADLPRRTRSSSVPLRRPLECVANSLLSCGIQCEQSKDAGHKASPITLLLPRWHSTICCS